MTDRDIERAATPINIADIGIHDVRRVELCLRYRSNAGCRTIRITSDAGSVELTLYGNTIALDLLPRSSDFYDFDEAKAQTKAA